MKENDYISYPSNDNLNNHRNRDEEMHSCRIQGKKDICEVFELFDKPEQIDVYKYGIGIFDYRIYLCHIYRVFWSCTLGSNVV